jgi:lipopolysaccharide O-acetyltransferase
MKLLCYLRDNGIYYGGIVVYRKILHRVFSFFLARKFHVRRLFVHPSAKIIGLSNIQIGENFYAGKDLWLEAVRSHDKLIYNPRIIIKENVAFNDSVHIAATNYVEIGNNVLMASKIYISDHNHGSYQGEDQSNPETPPNLRPVSCDKRVVIEDNVWLGEFVAVLPGVTIGRGCIIGSNSVVSKSLPPFSIAVGSPARIVKRYNFDRRKWESI